MSFRTPNLGDTAHWIEAYTITLTKEGATSSTTHEFRPTFPPATFARKEYAHEFSGLQPSTRYSATVTAQSCAGTATSAKVSTRTSARIIIDGNANDLVYIYTSFNVTHELRALSVDDFDLNLFFAALSVTLSDNLAADVPSVARSHVATVFARDNVALGGIVVRAQINATEQQRTSVLDALSVISSPPCASPFTRKLADFSSSFSRLCVVMTSSSSGTDDLTATEPPTTGPSEDPSWQQPVIIAGAALGGACVSVCVCVCVSVRLCVSMCASLCVSACAAGF